MSFNAKRESLNNGMDFLDAMTIFLTTVVVKERLDTVKRRYLVDTVIGLGSSATRRFWDKGYKTQIPSQSTRHTCVGGSGELERESSFLKTFNI